MTRPVTNIDVAIDNIQDALRELERIGDTAGLRDEIEGVLEYLQALSNLATKSRELERFLR